MMPWSMYAKRPVARARVPVVDDAVRALAARHAGPAAGRRSTDYYRHDVGDADAQFDHQETTLSHLLRVPHPALANRTYGQALVDALLARGAIPERSRARARDRRRPRLRRARRDRAPARGGPHGRVHDRRARARARRGAEAAARRRRDVDRRRRARRRTCPTARSISCSPTRWSATCRRSSCRASTSASSSPAPAPPIAARCAR